MVIFGIPQMLTIESVSQVANASMRATSPDVRLAGLVVEKSHTRVSCKIGSISSRINEEMSAIAFSKPAIVSSRASTSSSRLPSWRAVEGAETLHSRKCGG